MPLFVNDEAVSMQAVEKFVRKLGHDWRNSLNCLDLHLSAVRQSDDASEQAAEIQAAHGLVQQAARQISLVSRRIALCEARLIPYPATFFIEDLCERVQNELGRPSAARFAWKSDIGQQKLELDFEALASALLEIFHNAIQFSPQATFFTMEAGMVHQALQFTLLEPKKEDPQPEKWQHSALQSSLRGHYGLGLFHLRQVLKAHRGSVDFSFDPAIGALRTTIRLPLLGK